MDIEVGPYFQCNQLRVVSLTDDDWRVALDKCKQSIKWRLKQRTLHGAHSPGNLGADPVDHYLGIAYEKILNGDWEWKTEHSLSEQMIIIANKYIGLEVDKMSTDKKLALQIVYKNLEEEFYFSGSDPPGVDEAEYEQKLKIIEAAVAEDAQLIFMLECLKEGKKRNEIATLMDLHPRQFDKLKEKLERKVKKYNQQK